MTGSRSCRSPRAWRHLRTEQATYLKLRRRKGIVRFEAIQFNFAESVLSDVRAAYRLAVNEFNGLASVQQPVLEHIEPA